MNLRQTAEVSAIVATSAAHVIDRTEPVPTESLHGYWKQSRTRLKCWFAGLRAGCEALTGGETTPTQQSRLISLSREILVTEMLTRVWSTVLTASDRRQPKPHADATARNTYQGHLEARSEVLRLIADERCLRTDQQISLDRFRRRIERWTDALLGPLLADYGIADYVFNLTRAREFSADARQSSLHGAANAHLPLLVAGISAAFPKASEADQERMLLNRAIVRSILAAFPRDAFPSGGQNDSVNQSQVPSTSDHPESSPTSPDVTPDVPPRSSGNRLSFANIRRSAGVFLSPLGSPGRRPLD